jgi:peptide chain release factor 3
MGYDLEYIIYGSKTLIYSVVTIVRISKKPLLFGRTKPRTRNNNWSKPADTLREELELIDEVYPKFDRQDYLDGKLQPVFFGSALNNFGVRELLDCFVSIAPSPRPKESETRLVDPKEEKMSGFVFKINMDPNIEIVWHL